MNQSARTRLAKTRATWESLATADPFWAVLTEPDKKGGRWTPEAFYAKGRYDFERELAPVLRSLSDLPRGRALDFGCGAGRMSFPLADVFDEVVGVDISRRMLELAREHDSTAGHCQFVHNDCPDLALFPDRRFDLVYCHIVLQHVRPAYARIYLKEFARVLRPSGVGWVQIPDLPATDGTDADVQPGVIEMHGLPRPEVEMQLERNGCALIDVSEDGWCGPEVRSWRYLFRKA